MDDRKNARPPAPQERIAQLEKQVEELLQQISALQNTVTDWHSAMFGALNLILKPHKFNLTLEREHLLNLMPTRIDCLVVKKDGSIPIDMDVFRLFRKHNIIELKSYRDGLDESVLWHTIAYAASYRSLEPGVETEELTITLFRSSHPRKLLEELSEHGWTVEQPYHNIFYVSGKVDIPIQIVVAKDLGDEYIPLQILTGQAREAEVRKFAAFRETLVDKADLTYADAILWACSEANEELFRKLKEDDKMAGVLRELMKEELLREREEGEKKGREEGLKKGREEGEKKGREEGQREGEKNGAAYAYKAMAERMIDANKPGDEIQMFTALKRSEIDSLARMRNRTVNWESSASA